MQLALAAIIITLAAALVTAAPEPRDCSTSSQFGEMAVNPVSVKPGDSMVVTVDYRCSMSTHNVTPMFVDNYFMALDEHGQFRQEYFMFVSHQDFNPNKPVHTFAARLPVRQYPANLTIFTKAEVIYPAKDESGATYLATGRSTAPITLK